MLPPLARIDWSRRAIAEIAALEDSIARNFVGFAERFLVRIVIGGSLPPMGSKSSSDSFPGFESLFRLSDPLANPQFRGEALTDQPAELFRAECSPAEPVRVRRSMGGGPPT